MIRKGNVTIGLQTRFGPDWTGIRCGARTKLGGECQRPAVKKTGRCTRHGGKSTGPRTQVGRNKIAAPHTTHGKYTKAKMQEAQKSAEVGRRVRAEIKLFETCLIEQGWSYSKIENLEKIFDTENTSYSTIEFTRYTREGLKISSARGVWIATFKQNKWGMQMRSAYPTFGSVSFLGGQSK